MSREAYGVRGACSRFRIAPHVRQREQAPRTPYASRGLVPAMPAWGQDGPLAQRLTVYLRNYDLRLIHRTLMRAFNRES